MKPINFVSYALALSLTGCAHTDKNSIYFLADETTYKTGETGRVIAENIEKRKGSYAFLDKIKDNNVLDEDKVEDYGRDFYSRILGVDKSEVIFFTDGGRTYATTEGLKNRLIAVATKRAEHRLHGEMGLDVSYEIQTLLDKAGLLNSDVIPAKEIEKYLSD